MSLDRKKEKCEKCGKKYLDLKGHKKRMHPVALDANTIMDVEMAEPKTEPEQPKESVEKITMQQDYTEVPKLQLAEPEFLEINDSEAQKSEITEQKNTALSTQTEPEKLDLEGIDEVVVSIIDARLKKSSIDPFTDDEKERIHKYTNRVLKKYAYILVKYADVFNLVIAVSFPFIARIEQIDAARKRNEAKHPETKTEIRESAIQESAQEKAMREYERLKGVAGA